MKIDLSGRVAMVTGAGRGLGRSHALELAHRGARVVVNDLGCDLKGDGQSNLPADEVMEAIRANGGQAFASYEDVSDEDQAKAVVEHTLSKFGTIDIVVNNAGNAIRNGILDLSTDDFLRVLQVHLLGTFFVTREAGRVMRHKGYGRIVMTTSQVGFFGKEGSGAYAAAKMAIIGLMMTLRLELAQHNVLFNAISPFAYSRMAAEAFPADLEPWLDPVQVSAVVAFLSSEACRFSGEILVAGGGHFSIARMLESRGIDIEDPSLITAEEIAEKYKALSDMSDAIAFPDAMAAVGQTFEKVRRRAEG
jgi:NAD(P)-dependent dehydrogenase (short-subunit alcohol dehydrogenase family)